MGHVPGAQRPWLGARRLSETGYCVSGTILDYWERNGGLPVFGYPLGEARVETIEGTWTGTVQWFERDRLRVGSPLKCAVDVPRQS